jgi:hypothetical protein
MTADTGQTRVITMLTFEHAREWAAAHGFDANNVAAVEIVFDGNNRTSSGFMVLAEFTVYRLDGNGHKYKDPETNDAAIETVTVPVQSWPTLT